MPTTTLCTVPGCLKRARRGGPTSFGRQCDAHYNQTPDGAEARRREAAKRASKGKRWKGPVWPAFTREEWCRMYDEQSGRCAMCQKPLRDRWRNPDDQAGQLAAVDHCHDTETALLHAGCDVTDAVRRSTRGLLCSFPCNSEWPRYFTAERLWRLAAYATDFPAQRCLTHADTATAPQPAEIRERAAAARAETERRDHRPRGFTGLVP